MLELVEAAIQRALVSQRYRNGSGASQVEQENPDLNALFRQRAELLAEINAGSSMASLGEMEIVT